MTQVLRYPGRGNYGVQLMGSVLWESGKARRVKEEKRRCLPLIMWSDLKSPAMSLWICFRLRRCRPDLLQEWVPILCPELVKRSLERPLVSGFYRLVTLVFKETAQTGYFDERAARPQIAVSDEVTKSRKRVAFVFACPPPLELVSY